MNQETVALIESSQGWRELANAAASGRTPQSVGVVIPHIMQKCTDGSCWVMTTFGRTESILI